MYSVDEFKRLYPEMFSPARPIDIIMGVLILSLLFVVPYLYIRFLENRVISFLGNRLIPFIEFRLKLKKMLDIIHRILEMRIFYYPRSKI